MCDRVVTSVPVLSPEKSSVLGLLRVPGYSHFKSHRRRHTTLVHEPRALAGLGRAQRNALGAAVSTLLLDYVQQLEG